MLTNLPTHPSEGQRITISQIPLIYLGGHWVLDKEALEPPPIRHRDVVERDTGIAHPAKVISVEETGDSLEVDLKNIRQLITDLRKVLTESNEQGNQSFSELWEVMNAAVRNHEDLIKVVDNLKQTHQTTAAILKNDIKLSFATLVDNFTPILFNLDTRLKQHKSDIEKNKNIIDDNQSSLLQRLRDFRESLTEKIYAVDELAKKANREVATNKMQLGNHNDRLLALVQEDSEINEAINVINQTLESMRSTDNDFSTRIGELGDLSIEQSAELDKHKQNLLTLSSAVDKLKTRSDELNDRIGSYDNTLSNYYQRIASNKEDIGYHKELINSINANAQQQKRRIDLIQETIAVNISALDPSDSQPLVPGTPWLPDTKTNARTRALPAPSEDYVGKYLYLRDINGNAGINNICVQHNGNYIESSEDDLYLDTDYCWCLLMCVSKGNWRIVAGGA